MRRPRSRASTDVGYVDHPGRDSTEDGVKGTELQKAKRRVNAVRAIRCSGELEGSRSANATRADQIAYARGTITAAELRDRVWRQYNVQ